MSGELPELIVADAKAWQDWLRRHHGQQSGVWLVLAKKGTTSPTVLTYDQALEEALCHGWIDGHSTSAATSWPRRCSRRSAPGSATSWSPPWPTWSGS